MNKNTKNSKGKLEVKKIKAKLQTTMLIAIVATVLLSVSLVQVAEAEEIHGFYGLDDLFKDPNSIVKLYKSGGFSLKNYDSGIAVFAHPVDKTEMWKFTVMYDGKVSRFVVESEPLVDDENTQSSIQPSVNSTRIEPKSSVGADITKWDIPTTIQRSPPNEMVLTLEGHKIKKIHLDQKYDQVFKFYDARTNTNLENQKLIFEISRDGFIYKTIETLTNKGGLARIQIDEMSYPLFYPNFCYDIKVIAHFNNQTAVWNDDFVMEYTIGTRTWEPNMDWISESRWNYLPNNFQEEPRYSVFADEFCN